MAENSRQMYVRLVNMRNQAGSLLYQRILLASRLLADHEWVDSPDGGGGDESTAIDRLEADALADVCGAVSLPQMLEILRAVPEEATWKANKYNIRRMYEEMKARQTPKRKVVESKDRPTQAPVQTVFATREAEVEDRREKKIASLSEQLDALREENRQLKEENRKLRAWVKKFRAMQEAIPEAALA